MDERLGGGGRARRYIAENDDGNRGDHERSFETIDGRDQSKNQRRSGDGDSGGGADGADVGIQGGGVQVHTTMQLRREEDAREEESQKVDGACFARHFAGIRPFSYRTKLSYTGRGDLRYGKVGGRNANENGEIVEIVHVARPAPWPISLSRRFEAHSSQDQNVTLFCFEHF